MPRYTQHIGPPHTPFRGMNTRARRQQLAPSEFYGLRNAELSEGAIASRPGIARLLTGARTAKSLSFTSGTVSQYATLSSHTDYALPPNWTAFVAYKIDATPVAAIVAQMSKTSSPFSITHTGPNITATVYNGTSTITLNSNSLWGKLGQLIEVQLVRAGATITLYVNGVSRDVDTGNISSTYTNTAGDIFFASHSTAGVGFKGTFYEFRLFREAMTSHYWRHIQYPWSGKFGDPNLACHLTFEDGTGTSITDHSRNGNNATITGSPTWNSATARQVVTPISGIQVMENARGRKWLLVESGPNHYRIPLN